MARCVLRVCLFFVYVSRSMLFHFEFSTSWNQSCRSHSSWGPSAAPPPGCCCWSPPAAAPAASSLTATSSAMACDE